MDSPVKLKMIPYTVSLGADPNFNQINANNPPNGCAKPPIINVIKTAFHADCNARYNGKHIVNPSTAL